MGERPHRRRVLYGLGGLAAGAAGLRYGTPWFLRHRGPRPLASLSDAARSCVREAFAGVDAARVWDLHAHLVGLGTGDSGAWVNPDMRSPWRPLESLRFEIYLAAAGVTSLEDADAQYLDRLLELQRQAHPKGRIVLLAFDLHVDEQGRERRDRSAFHTPDAFALAVARAHPEVAACASIHPYRRDALARLERAAEAGAVAVKWLPNAMGIDPADARCDAFYDRLAALDLPLLSHTGVERAVHVGAHQRFGNPLRLRRPLERGVRVVAAHCATLGRSEDLDHPSRRERPAFELFLRLMGEPEHEGRLFGGLSAVTLVNRDAAVLRELLAARELHPRLVNGSDYPLPAIDPLVSTWLLARGDVLDPELRGPLGEVFDANPLLFDFVLKRCLRVERGGTTHRFLPTVFETARLFGA